MTWILTVGDSETDDDDVVDGENPSFTAADDGEVNDCYCTWV